MSDDDHAVRYTGRTSWRNRAGLSASVDDPLIEGLSADDAATLADRPQFERVEREGDSDGSDSEADADDPDEAFDEESFLGRTPMSEVISDIEAGMVDAYLDELAEAADRVGVKDAIDARRDETDD